MAEGNHPAPTLVAAMPGALGARLTGLLQQPAVRRALPALAGLGALGAVGLLYLTIADGPSRVLYSTLSDEERAGVTAALDAGGISYDIDPASGVLSVAEDDLYRARMLVASDGALASPDNTVAMLDSIPLGSSRTLEGERLRNVREQELVRSIQEINGVESVRVHLASPERSVFVREQVEPSASVMLRMARGRVLSAEQVQAIVNLVSGSVPGLAPEAVRVVDQQGNLLSDTADPVADALDLQRAFEDKLRLQVAQLLTPMLGEGNFSSEVQVELDMAEVTRAQESYDNEGVVRQVSESSTNQSGETVTGGIPGVLANTPAPPPQLQEGPPTGAASPSESSTMSGNGAQSSERTYALGREVAVSSERPGGVQRISVAVALSSEALEKIAPATAQQVQALVSAAVGADSTRGDRVTVVAGAFEPVEEVSAPFWETSWFALALRYGVGLIVAVLALFLVVRPLLAALNRKGEAGGDERLEGEPSADERTEIRISANNPVDPAGMAPGSDDLREQVQLARRLAAEQPERAASALRRMLAEPSRS